LEDEKIKNHDNLEFYNNGTWACVDISVGLRRIIRGSKKTQPGATLKEDSFCGNIMEGETRNLNSSGEWNFPVGQKNLTTTYKCDKSHQCCSTIIILYIVALGKTTSSSAISPLKRIFGTHNSAQCLGIFW